MAKKVLLIAYYFPPLGGAGIGRPVTLFNELDKQGWECHVLTTKPVAYRTYDYPLLETLDKNRIYRAGSFDPQRLMYLVGMRTIKGSTIDRGRAVADKFFPDSKVGWVRKAVSLGRTLMSNRRYDLIMSTSPPISTHLVGQRLAAEFDVPWVADFRDYWTMLKPEEWYDSPVMVEKAYALLDIIKKNATAVTAVNETLAEFLSTKHAIYNSYDSSDVVHWENESDKREFKIGLFGSYSEISPVKPLLELLDKLSESNSELTAKVKIQQVGTVNDLWFNQQLEGTKWADRVDRVGFLPRGEAIKKAAECSAFFVSCPSERDRGIMISRLFYLLASGRPIIANAPIDSEVEKQLRNIERGCCFDDLSRAAAVEFLRDKIRQFVAGTLKVEPLPDDSKRFSSEHMVNSFARLFDNLIEK